MPSPQYSYTFYYRMYARLLLHSFCYTSCGIAICAVSSTTCIFLSPFQKEHSLHLCPFSLYLKHSTSIVSYLLIILSFTLYCITLLNNTLNLFWGVVVPFSSSFLFLQLWTRCLNPLQFLHNFLLLSSSFSLSLVRVHFSLSKLLINELYCCKDIVLCLCVKDRVEQEQGDLEWKGVDNKSGEQPWPQLMHCALIFCCICGCIFQEDGIVARSSGEEWYIDKSEDRTCKRCYRR